MVDGRYRGREPVVEADDDPLSIEETARTFHTIRRSSAVWVAVITACASIVTTYLLTHAAPTNCASAGDMNAAQKSISELSSAVTKLTETVNKNGDVAHNETAAVALDQRLNASEVKQAIGLLNSKIDTFTRGK